MRILQFCAEFDTQICPVFEWSTGQAVSGARRKSSSPCPFAQMVVWALERCASLKVQAAELATNFSVRSIFEWKILRIYWQLIRNHAYRYTEFGLSNYSDISANVASLEQLLTKAQVFL